MNRIEQRLDALKKENKKAFITYITAGLPDSDKCAELIRTQEKAGIDIIELGIPFSDPIADGPVIQAASYKAIMQGTNLRNVFDMIEGLRADCEVPIVFMMYYNTVLYYGIKEFVEKCADVGVDGVIIPDLPYEETFEIKEYLDTVKDAPILVPLVSPVSRDRIPMLVNNARGFVYCVSSMGVTGQDAHFHKSVNSYLQDVKAQSPVPVMMGFGIRTAADVEPYRQCIDGCIVGSHFITLLEESGYNLDAAADYIKTFKAELNR